MTFEELEPLLYSISVVANGQKYLQRQTKPLSHLSKNRICPINMKRGDECLHKSLFQTRRSGLHRGPKFKRIKRSLLSSLFLVIISRNKEMWLEQKHLPS